MDGVKNLAIAVAILAGSVAVLTLVDQKKMINAVVVIGILAGILIGLTAAMEKLSTASAKIDWKNGISMEGLKAGLLAIAGSLLLMAATVKIIGSMSPEEATRGFFGLVGMVAAIAAVFTAYGLVAKFLDIKDVDKVGKMLFKVSASILILTIVAKMLAGMTWGDIGKAATGILGLTGVIALLMTISMIPGKNLDTLGSSLMKIAGAFVALVIVAKLIAGMTWGDMGKAAVGLLGLTGIIALLATITMIPGLNTNKLGSTLLGISVAMAALTIVAKMIAGMSWGDMGKAAVGLLGLTGVVAALVGIVRLCKNDAPKIAGTLLALSVSIGILAGVAVILSLIDLGGLAKGITAIGLLSSFMALMIYATRGASDCKGNLIVMSVAIATMVGAVAILTLLDPVKMAGATLALSMLIGMFALMAKSAGTMSTSVKNLVIMTGAIALIAGIIYLLTSLPIESSLSAAGSLSILLLSLTASVTIISKISTVASKAMLATGLMVLIIGALAGILYLLKDLPIESTLGTASALSMLLLSLSAACGVLTLVGLGGPAALIGVGSLAALIVGIGGLIVGLGALVDKFPMLETFLDVGIPILEKIGYAIGSFFGNIAGGFIGGMSSGLPELAANLSVFMAGLQPFIDGAKTVDASVLKGIGCLSAAILLLSAADLIQGITSFRSGGFASLGSELSMFILAAQPFLSIIKTVDPAAIESVKALAEMILVLTAADILQGITSFIPGVSSFADFGAQLIPFGAALVAFSDTVKGRIDETAVTAAANAGKIMSEMANTLPNSGGVLGFFAGENDMATFGAQLIPFGKALATFSDTVKGRIDETAITAAASAGKMMSEMANTIPNTGGLVSFFTGDNDLVTFSTQLVVFGGAIVSFSDAVKGRIDETAITAAASAGKVMVELSNTIPNTGGLVSFFTGDNDMATFGKQLKSFGSAMTEYSQEVTGLDTEAITTSVTAASKLSGLQNSMDKTGGLVSIFAGDSGLDDFGKNLKKFGKAMADYSKSISGINANNIDAATTSFQTLLKMCKSAENVDFDGIDSFGTALKKLGKSGVKKFVEAFTDGADDVKTAGGKLTTNASDGVESKESVFKKSSKTVAKAGADGVSDKKSSFKSAGKDLGDGLVEGIKAKEKAVYKAGYALGQKAVEGEKDGQKSHSPSKLTILAGKWLGEGLVIGIGNMTKAVYTAGHNLGESATNSISSTISRIGDVISADVDAQPTIRPVLDLSDVSSGVNTLNGMLDMNSAIGLMANVNSISGLASSRQNGNVEVVSALDKLNKTMSKLRSGDTYNVNGITYSSGNEISDAVNVLVRATTMEGRV